MKQSRIRELFQGVKEKYLQPEELNEWNRIVEEGLTLYEDHYIKKYIDRQGMVLDIGCGGGRESIAMSSHEYKMVGIDLVLPMVINARANAKIRKKIIEVAVMNACFLGFKDEIFTGVLLLGQILSFIPLRKNRIMALKEAFRVLKPRGKLIMTTHSKKSHIKYQLYFLIINSWRKFLRLFGMDTLEPGDRFASTVSKAKSKGKHYLHMYSLEETVQDLTSAGFHVLSCHSRKEILEGKEMPKQRERDYYLIYAATKST